jgi:DNA-binding CsgD family transcriptional regulator
MRWETEDLISAVGVLLSYSNFGDQAKRIRRLLDLPQRQVEAESLPCRQVRYRQHLDDDAVNELVALYLGGATVYEIADCFSIHRDRVSKLLEEAGIDRRYHERVDVDLERADRLHRQGLNLTEVAKRLGIGRNTLVVARRRAT